MKRVRRAAVYFRLFKIWNTNWNLHKGNWGPHLIIVPTSVMLNWEMELKRWCPGFKILTYFGSQKERKLKRQVTLAIKCTCSVTPISLCNGIYVSSHSHYNTYFLFPRAGLSQTHSMFVSLHTNWCCRITRHSDASLGATWSWMKHKTSRISSPSVGRVFSISTGLYRWQWIQLFHQVGAIVSIIHSALKSDSNMK